MIDSSFASKTGLVYQLNEAGIHEYHFYDLKPATVDNWQASVAQIDQDGFERGEHVRFLFYIYNLWPTTYSTQRSLAASKQLPPAHKYSTAIVLQGYNTIALKMMQMVLRQMPQGEGGHQVRQIFFNEAEALKWLDERQNIIA